MRKYETFGGEIEVDDGEEDSLTKEDLEAIDAYADRLEAMTPEEFAAHQREIQAAREFGKLEEEGLI